jgi:hypothetical protein
MTTLFPPRTVFRLALGGLVAASALASRPAGASPSITADMPPEIRSLRVEILPPAEYGKLASQWRAYAKAHPECAVAPVEQARALRYEGKTSPDEQLALLRRALTLDPGCPEALDAAAGTWLGTPHKAHPIVSSLDEAIAFGMRALERAPDWPDPHFALWTHCVLAGRPAEAEGHLLALARTHAFPAPLVDFAYNLLASADPSATLFTNGDNDTYPPLMLQALRGLRPDVAIVNLSLLNVPAYARSVWTRAFPDAPPFTGPELDSLLAKPMPAPGIVDALVRKARNGSWPHPVCFALTVADERLADYRGSLRIEGLLWHLEREVVPDAGKDAPIDLDRTLALFRDTFRLESATDPAYPWGDTDAVTQIVANYPAVLRIVATGSARRERVEDVRFAMRTALAMLECHGQKDQVTAFATYWKQLEPDNPETDRWK